MIFLEALYEEVISNLKNDFSNNYDYILLGEEPMVKKHFSFIGMLKNYFHQRNYRNIKETIPYLKLCLNVEKYYSYLYERLVNEDSKKLLIQVVAYRILGHRKVKLPLSNEEYWQSLHQIELLANKSMAINPKFLHFILYYFDLKSLGYDIRMYYNALGILIEFIIKQYDLIQADKIIKTQKGNVVFDCGACWGDTALFFANRVGETGKVYSIEFIPSNLQILKANLNLNPSLEKVVKIIEQPLHSESGVNLYYKDNGPASMVKSEFFVDSNGIVSTITIDEIVQINKIEAVDFIKMDIEGAELDALKGSINTIKTFKPILSIALYHRETDFYDIPMFIDKLGLGYKFYINHNTIHHGETVLFAEV